MQIFIWPSYRIRAYMHRTWKWINCSSWLMRHHANTWGFIASLWLIGAIGLAYWAYTYCFCRSFNCLRATLMTRALWRRSNIERFLLRFHKHCIWHQLLVQFFCWFPIPLIPSCTVRTILWPCRRRLKISEKKVYHTSKQRRKVLSKFRKLFSLNK
jgi:hypothetical protein